MNFLGACDVKGVHGMTWSIPFRFLWWTGCDCVNCLTFPESDLPCTGFRVDDDVETSAGFGLFYRVFRFCEKFRRINSAANSAGTLYMKAFFFQKKRMMQS